MIRKQEIFQNPRHFTATKIISVYVGTEGTSTKDLLRTQNTYPLLSRSIAGFSVSFIHQNLYSIILTHLRLGIYNMVTF